MKKCYQCSDTWEVKKCTYCLREICSECIRVESGAHWVCPSCVSEFITELNSTKSEISDKQGYRDCQICGNRFVPHDYDRIRCDNCRNKCFICHKLINKANRVKNGLMHKACMENPSRRTSE